MDGGAVICIESFELFLLIFNFVFLNEKFYCFLLNIHLLSVFLNFLCYSTQFCNFIFV